MKEDLRSMSEDIIEKEKVMFPEIVVHGTKDKPYYAIKYYDVADKELHLGYGSYNLEYVMQWKEECLEVVEGNIMSGAFEKIVERFEEKVKGWLDLVSVDETVAYAEISAYNKAIEIVKEVAGECAEKEFSEWCHDCPAYDKENHHCPRLCKVIRTVVEEIKEGNNSKWIPISSGNLPDIYTQVLCCNDSGEVMVGRISWDEDSEDFVAWGRIGAYNDWMPQVVAWMPIVPYKEGE